MSKNRQIAQSPSPVQVLWRRAKGRSYSGGSHGRSTGDGWGTRYLLYHWWLHWNPIHARRPTRHRLSHGLWDLLWDLLWDRLWDRLSRGRRTSNWRRGLRYHALRMSHRRSAKSRRASNGIRSASDWGRRVDDSGPGRSERSGLGLWGRGGLK